MVWGRVPDPLFACGYTVVSAPRVKEMTLSPLNGLGALVKVNWLWVWVWVWGFIWTLSSIPPTCMSALMTVTRSLSYGSFVVSFEIGKCESSFFLFQDSFGYSEFLEFFHMRSRISLSISTKKPAGVLTEITLNLYINFGDTAFLTM